eukprot:gene1325-2554_t
MATESTTNDTSEETARRLLRKEQRLLHEEMLDNRENMRVVGSEVFSNLRMKNNALFLNTGHTREQFNDALNLKEISKAANIQAEHLDDMSRKYDFQSWANVVKQKYENSEDHIFSWSDFGKDIGTLFLRAPRVCPMLGVINNEVKIRTMAKRSKKEYVAETRPEEQQGTGEQAEATNLRIIHLWEYLKTEQSQSQSQSLSLTQSQSHSQGVQSSSRKQATQQSGVTEEELDENVVIDLFHTLVDPKDNVQTIENFFDFAFLVKDKRVVQTLDAEGVPVTIPVNDMEEDGQLAGSRKQMVLSLAMKDLQSLSEYSHKIDDPLYAAKDAREQANILADRAEIENAERDGIATTTTTKKKSQTQSLSQTQSQLEKGKGKLKPPSKRNAPATSSTTSSSLSQRKTNKRKAINDGNENDEDDEDEDDDDDSEEYTAGDLVYIPNMFFSFNSFLHLTNIVQLWCHEGSNIENCGVGHFILAEACINYKTALDFWLNESLVQPARHWNSYGCSYVLSLIVDVFLRFCVAISRKIISDSHQSDWWVEWQCGNGGINSPAERILVSSADTTDRVVLNISLSRNHSHKMKVLGRHGFYSHVFQLTMFEGRIVHLDLEIVYNDNNPEWGRRS